jgi:Uma2 family endonuclease
VDAVTAALQHPVGPFTVEDWHALSPRDDGSRLELLWGHWLVNPPPSMYHQYAGDEIRTVLRDAIRTAGRTDLFAVTASGADISTKWRNGLIPDVLVVNVLPVTMTAAPENLVLVVETWSPGNKTRERTAKADAYALAGVPHFWTVEQNRFGRVTAVTAYRLAGGQYVEATRATPGTVTEFEVAGVPVKFDPADLMP